MPQKLGGFTPSTVELYLSEGDCKRFEEAGRITLGREQCAELGNTINKYRTALDSWRHEARPKPVRTLLNKLDRQAMALHTTLGELLGGGAAAGEALWQLAQAYSTYMQGAPGLLQEAQYLQSQIHALALAAKKVQDTLPSDTPGEEGDPYRYHFIQQLHKIFKQSGGRGKITYDSYGNRYKGRFYQFAMLAFDYAPGRKRKGDIGKSIQEALAGLE